MSFKIEVEKIKRLPIGVYQVTVCARRYENKPMSVLAQPKPAKWTEAEEVETITLELRIQPKKKHQRLKASRVEQAKEDAKLRVVYVCQEIIKALESAH